VLALINIAVELCDAAGRKRYFRPAYAGANAILLRVKNEVSRPRHTAMNDNRELDLRATVVGGLHEIRAGRDRHGPHHFDSEMVVVISVGKTLSADEKDSAGNREAIDIDLVALAMVEVPDHIGTGGRALAEKVEPE
jgi:hypothetical protein